MRFEAASRWSRWAPPSGSADDLVDDAEAEQVAAGELEGRGGLGGVFAPFPEDRGAALGADDRVIGVLEHPQPVADADAQRAAGAPLADHHADDRGADLAHLHQVLGDDRRLAALLGRDARIGARGVDERDDRQAELGGEPHLQQGLAIALGVGAAEVAGGPLGQVLALLVADEHDLQVVEDGPVR